jgi:hypothetical protein
VLIKKPLRSLSVLVAVAAFAVPSHADEVYKLLQVDGHSVKWGVPKPGTGATITYRLAARPSSAGSVNCRQITPIEPLLAHSRISHDNFDRALEGAFQAWEAVTNVRFVRVPNDRPANLTIGAENTPDGIAYSDVTPASSTTASISPLDKAVICLNPRVHWTAKLALKKQSAKALSYVLMHEIGHVLGLDHPGPTGELMSFEYSETVRTLQAGDITGIISLYGAAPRRDAVALNAPAHH